MLSEEIKEEGSASKRGYNSQGKFNGGNDTTGNVVRN
jgi:hypothetical protein